MGLISRLKRLASLKKFDEFTDLKIRAEFRKEFNINVGLYSYGCFDRLRIDRDTTIGRYCSMAPTVAIYNRNHGLDYLSTHPYWYNTQLGVVETDILERIPCEIGDDVWFGHNSVITPSCSRIGRGAVIAAGAVVTQNVEPYTIVAGVPAKPLRKRFTPEVIEQIEALRWWEWDLDRLRRELAQRPDLLYRPAAVLARNSEHARAAAGE